MSFTTLGMETPRTTLIPLQTGLDRLNHGTLGRMSVLGEEIPLRAAKDFLLLAILYLVDDHGYALDLSSLDRRRRASSLFDEACCRVTLLLASISVGAVLYDEPRAHFLF